MKKAIVIGLDGFEPKLVERLLQTGALPNLARLREQGGISSIQTTYPAETPVAWSTFATGMNPGGHGIFDFIRRDPKTYLPDLSLNRYEQKNAFLPPKAVNLRRGAPLWELLSTAGLPSCIIRCPCCYPPDNIRGRMLAGMGVPDMRGGLGTSTFYTTQGDVAAQESENVIGLKAGNGIIRTRLIGPRDPKTRSDFHFEFDIHVEPARKRVVIRSDGQPKELIVGEGQWSDWLKVKFKTGLLQSARGMVRFHLVRLEPVLELYASPLNFDPQWPLFPISHPTDYAAELEEKLGTFYTTGMVEDHGGLNNGRFDEGAYLAQCRQTLRERESMMLYELGRMKDGFFFCLFDTPDRLQHMFWRFGEDGHPANRDGNGSTRNWKSVIEDHYRECDAVIGRALEHADDDTLFITLSDHGMNSFQRGMHLNSWLHDQGLLAFRNGGPGEEAGDFFRGVDWSRTKAYALGLGGIYINLQGREQQGIVDPAEAERLKAAIAAALAGFPDPERGQIAVRRVCTREQIYSGPYAAESPDLLVNFAAGYRVSWETALGGSPRGHFADNTKRWGGDHIIDPLLAPGVLLMNRPFHGDSARLLDMAPTILNALGVPQGSAMEGHSLLT
jgi:predicted AlkP superfamily phosphohydrolase/phosphomutase